MGYYKYQTIEKNMLDLLLLLSGCEKIFFCLEIIKCDKFLAKWKSITSSARIKSQKNEKEMSLQDREYPWYITLNFCK